MRGIGRGLENESEGWGVETCGGDDSGTGSVTKKNGEKIDDRCRCQPETSGRKRNAARTPIFS